MPLDAYGGFHPIGGEFILYDGRKNVLRAMRDDPVLFIGCVPRHLLFDREVVETALNKVCKIHTDHPSVLSQVISYIPRYFLRDWDFMAKMIARHPVLIRFVEDDVLRDREVLHRMAVASHGDIFKYLKYYQRETEEVVDGFFQSLIAECGSALAYASTTLRGDKEVVRAAVRNYGDAIASACEQVIDLDLCVLAARNGASRDSLPPAFRNEADVVLGLAEHCCFDIHPEVWHLLEDRDFVSKISRVATMSQYLDTYLPLHMRHDVALLVQRRVDEIGHGEYAELLKRLRKEHCVLLAYAMNGNRERNLTRLDQIADCLPYAAASIDRERKRIAECMQETKRRKTKEQSVVDELAKCVEELARDVHCPHHPLNKMRKEDIPFVGDVSESHGANSNTPTS